MTTSITIVPAVGIDICGIQDVLLQAWLATYPNKEYDITEEDIRYRFEGRQAEELILRRKHYIECPRPGAIYLVARDGEHIIGTCFAHREITHNELLMLYVLPAYHGTGVGFALWQEAQKLFDSARDTIVRVVAYNKAAIDFYVRLGFDLYGVPPSSEFIKMRNGAQIPEIEMLLERT